jgi:hypothetical protein
MEEIKDVITFVGQITPEDVEDGTVLIFRISDAKFPQKMMDSLVKNITQSVTDMFDGQVKAMIVPDYIEVTMLKDILKEKVDNE